MGNRLRDRIPLGSLGYGPVLGGYVDFFRNSRGPDFFLIKKNSDNREGSGFFTSKIQRTVRVQGFNWIGLVIICLGWYLTNAWKSISIGFFLGVKYPC